MPGNHRHPKRWGQAPWLWCHQRRAGWCRYGIYRHKWLVWLQPSINHTTRMPLGDPIMCLKRKKIQIYSPDSTNGLPAPEKTILL